MSNSNIVRDRTLVLRVLVPGLHTSLNDKINSIQDGEGKSSPSTPSSAAGGTIKADQLLNLEGVTCLPSGHGSTKWHFRCDGATYPARLVNLPCPVEVHKTVDHATYHKSSDAGQMLIVYEDEYAMEEAENAPGYKIEGFPSYYHSGLTPPMKRVVRRRFLSRFEERDVKPVPPLQGEVQNVEMEIKKLIEKLADKGKVGKGKKGAAAPPSKDRIITEIEEEILDYEPWMGDGGTFTLEDAKSHPEWWLSKSEIKEIEDAKAEEIQKEREAQAALRAEMEAQRLADEAAAEKKAKKQKKKKEKKKKQQEEEAKQESSKSVQSTVVAATEEMDEVTAAAMMINQEIDNEELLLDDDMFDFANEDISDLL